MKSSAPVEQVTPNQVSRPTGTRPAYGGFGRTFRRIFTFDRLEVVSLIHSTVYFALLVSAFALGGPQPFTFIFGLSHGLIWIAMAVISVFAVRYRVINLQLAVAIAVLGCIAPFFGSAEFLRQKHVAKKRERELAEDRNLASEPELTSVPDASE
jgi:hypothetical protein